MLKTRLRLFAIILAILLLPAKAFAEVEHELLLFLSAEGANKLLEANEDIKSPDGVLSADILYGFSWKQFHFLGEYLASNKETELERLQLGLEFGENNFAWIGRFHVPSNYWMTAYHHGQYLQTSISKPGIAEFEDFGGIIPSHTTGLLLDGTHVFDDSTGITTAFSIGTAPVLDDGFMENFDLLNPQSGHNLAYHFRFTYQPNYFDNNKIGLVASFADLNAERSTLQGQEFDAVEQITVGGFVDWYWQEWRLVSAVSHIINRLYRNNRINDDAFTVGFVQTEYELNQNWIFFGRVEESFSTGNSEYLKLIPNFVESRQMIGARFEFLQRHALTLELAHIETVKENFGQARLQWSAIFP
jgi:hypothetical protein